MSLANAWTWMNSRSAWLLTTSSPTSPGIGRLTAVRSTPTSRNMQVKYTQTRRESTYV
ncbi:hypothetical protein [Nannocystis pusilla]|uniref:hypothetical protein n=1 Tax=Nannocystis pusilla TaxID=889268 RepID=UPI003B806E80